jgi:hypothetical protein
MLLESILVYLLQEPSSIEKVAEIDEHIGCAMSGLTADAKTLVDHARADTQVRRSIRLLCCLHCGVHVYGCVSSQHRSRQQEQG